MNYVYYIEHVYDTSVGNWKGSNKEIGPFFNYYKDAEQYIKNNSDIFNEGNVSICEAEVK